MSVVPYYIDFVQNSLKKEIENISLITNSGSNRRYFRITASDNKTYILTENEWVEENKSYVYFNHIMSANQINVPKIIAIHTNYKAYIQEDLGDMNLLQFIHNKGFVNETYQLLQKTIQQLAHFQIQSKNNIDYTQCYDFQTFDEKVVQNDMFYFKNYFLDRLDIAYLKKDLIAEINLLAKQIKILPSEYFLYRDFQSRNVMLHDDNPYFIDFQGAMRGFIGYDLVSFLYQAKANIPLDWRMQLKNEYFAVFMEQENREYHILEEGFKWGMVLRFFQLLGAYGLRGLVENKAHFKESILTHIDNMQLLLHYDYLHDFPTLKQVTEQLTSSLVRKRIQILLK